MSLREGGRCPRFLYKALIWSTQLVAVRVHAPHVAVLADEAFLSKLPEPDMEEEMLDFLVERKPESRWPVS